MMGGWNDGKKYKQFNYIILNLMWFLFPFPQPSIIPFTHFPIPPFIHFRITPFSHNASIT